ncbi:Charged multivesicular body protein 6 [Babesia sp. Xinjiang]|uniref:Charged multivesicular body protein 6 n=1 Tax=Babesia sp. Xinjiang TaxID=462227 RepID=UPI000A25CCBD|nr:Charged multivesicular body protein 6 [Babesia sp. Xinjiang]XP_028872603.1 Charged multivesicular body protein 6 [Babesia sp. Xinjiang]ORM42104.1 Charged multivesicular body protein 6 [Babesia sp. Xinjiang]ORM42147.1 Charged multivesicular body protein 6 [Babesia sp. Xinjiang]
MGGLVSRCGCNSKKGNIIGQIVQLKGQRDELEEYRESLIDRLNELDEAAREYARHNEREKALLCLRKKALSHDQLSKIDNYLHQVLKVISDTEMAQVNLEVYKHLKIGAELLASMSKCMKLDDVEAMQAVRKDCRDNMEETTSVLNQSFNTEDDSALLKELDLLCGDNSAGVAHVIDEAAESEKNRESDASSPPESESLNSLPSLEKTEEVQRVNAQVAEPS